MQQYDWASALGGFSVIAVFVFCFSAALFMVKFGQWELRSVAKIVVSIAVILLGAGWAFGKLSTEGVIKPCPVTEQGTPACQNASP